MLLLICLLVNAIIKKHSINISWVHGPLWVRQGTQKKVEAVVPVFVELEIYSFKQEEEGKEKQMQPTTHCALLQLLTFINSETA